MEQFFTIMYSVVGLLILLSILIGPYIMYFIHNNNNKKIEKLEDKHREITDNLNDEYEREIEKLRSIHQNDIQMMKLSYDQSINSMYHSDLSLSDIDEVVDGVVNEIWGNKYYLKYYIRDVVIIPKMDVEIASMTKDVYTALSQNVKINALKYYSSEYFLQKITRQSEMLFMEYTRKHKPPSK